MSITFFKHPEPIQPKTRIWPVFMPFLGCPSKCIYCSQDRQTGTVAKSLTDIYQDIKLSIPAFFANGNRSPMELAFFGGTFTALPLEWQQRFISLTSTFKKEGFLTKVRCSTRPDCIDAESLTLLKNCGLDMVELGIQSFSAKVLRRSGRNYSPETAVKACRTVKESGLSLGIQLLPGLPGEERADFQKDVGHTIELNPDAVRIYPCLVVKGTGLEKLYRAGKYTPWSLARTEEDLSQALLRLWLNNIHVIRMGVAHEDGFEDNIVAGPVHPAIGQKARSKALYLFLRTQLALIKGQITKVIVPSRYSGELWGHKSELKPLYAKAGLFPEMVKFSKQNHFYIFSG